MIRDANAARLPDTVGRRRPMKKLGSYLIEALEAAGVRHVFGIPGVHNLELYRGLEGASLRHVTGRHEQGLGFMADGYARISGRPGVCFTISGPGVSNITTALGQAFGDSIPLLLIASQNRRGEAGSGRGLLHELPDQIGGPGVSNTPAALGQAFGDSIPLLLIASQNRRGEAGSGRGFLHELPD